MARIASPPSVPSAPNPRASSEIAVERTLAKQLELEARDKRVFRRALMVALVLHAGLFAVTFPSFSSKVVAEAERPKAYVVRPVRFKPKKPNEPIEIPEPRRHKMPMPDPTPHDPEPLTNIEPEVFEDFPVDLLDLELPLEAPPEPINKPVFVTGDVVKPVRIYDPPPVYTETARKVRTTGHVILQSTIDEQGNVIDIEVIKGLPMGLSESAVEAVRRWKFKPATLNGKPVAVYFNLTVRFDLN